MYSLRLLRGHMESKTILPVESTVVLLMSTQYPVRGRAFHITVMVFGAVRTSVMAVAIVKYLTMLMHRKLLTHHEQLELLWSIFQILQYQRHF